MGLHGMNTGKNKLLFSEVGGEGETHYHRVQNIHFQTQTEYQDMSIIETANYGKMLILDGRIQSAEKDEYIYHECLVHPGLIAHPKPQKVLVIGGGEGATIREILRHPSIHSVVMVDIDEQVVHGCMVHLPEWHQGAFTDPRTTLVFADGKRYVETTKERFDCVIIDICDALEEGPALALYTKEFYHAVKQILNPGGVVVVQAMELYALEHENHLIVSGMLKQAFRHVNSYSTYIPSFWCNWGYIVASDAINIKALSAHEVDSRLNARKLSSILRHYDGECHQHLFSLPKAVRALLDGDDLEPSATWPKGTAKPL